MGEVRLGYWFILAPIGLGNGPHVLGNGSVSDPDPDPDSRVFWIRIRIRNPDPDPDPGPSKKILKVISPPKNCQNIKLKLDGVSSTILPASN